MLGPLLSVSPRGCDLLCRWLREDPVDAVVGAGDLHCDGIPGGPAFADEYNRQHLDLLCGLHPLQGLLPVPRAHCHVSVENLMAVSALVFLGLFSIQWGGHE